MLGTQEEVENGGRDGNEDDDEDETEEKYGLLRNAAVKSVQAEYSTIMKGKKREGDDEDREIFESKILYLAKLDAWIMTLLMYMVLDDTL